MFNSQFPMLIRGEGSSNRLYLNINTGQNLIVYRDGQLCPEGAQVPSDEHWELTIEHWSDPRLSPFPDRISGMSRHYSRFSEPKRKLTASTVYRDAKELMWPR